MLTRLGLTNWQCWEKLDLELDPLCTTLIGPSDHGKSSVLRALVWLCSGRPRGQSFVRRGQGVPTIARVVLEVDGRTVRRARGGQRHILQFDGCEFANVAGELPQEVSRFLNLGSENFQAQTDPPFWFTLPAPQVGRELNKVISLDLIDKTLAGLAGEARQAKAELEVCSQRLTQAREERDRLTWVEECDLEFQTVEEFQTQQQETAAKAAALAVLLQEATGVALARKNALQAKEDALPGQELAERLLALRKRQSYLVTLVKQLRGVRAERCRVIKERRRLSRVLAKELGKGCPLCGQLKSEGE